MLSRHYHEIYVAIWTSNFMRKLKFIPSLLMSFFVLLSLNTHATTLKIGTSHYYPPFVLKGANQTLSGFDIDLMNKICSKLEAECTYTAMHFDELLPSLEQEKVDLVISAITSTSERKKQHTFSVPYMKSYGRLLVSNTLANKGQQFFLHGKKIGEEKGTVFESSLPLIAPKSATVILDENANRLVEKLIDGEIDVVLIDDPSAIWWTLNSSNKIRTIGDKFQVGEGLSIAISTKNKHLLPKINQAIAETQNEKAFASLHDAYFSHNTLPQ